MFCHLNYRTSGGERSESNRRPSECKSDALPTWATSPKWWKLRELNPNLFVFSEACRPTTLSFQWHRKKGLNLHKEFWRLSCYHYTIAIYKTKKNKKPQAFDLGLNMIENKKINHRFKISHPKQKLNSAVVVVAHSVNNWFITNIIHAKIKKSTLKI